MNQPDQQPESGTHPLRPGTIEQTLAGEADLRIGEVLREAWERIYGIKGMVVGGVSIVYAVLTIVILLLGSIFGIEDQDPVGGAVTQLVVMLVFYPFLAGVFMFGLRHSVGQPVRFEQLFAQYGHPLPIVAVALVQSALTTIGFLLLIVPGLYLSFAFALALPLKVERGLPLVDCLMISLRLVNRKFLEVVALSVLSGLLVALGILSLIGWIWTVPWVLMIYAIMYRQLAGVAGTGPAAPAPTAKVTAEY